MENKEKSLILTLGIKIQYRLNVYIQYTNGLS